MPHQAVSEHLELVLAAVADELVGHTEVEDALGGGQRLGLHAVLGYRTVEMLVDDSVAFRHLTVALPLVDGSADEAIFTKSVLQSLSRSRGKCHR